MEHVYLIQQVGSDYYKIGRGDDPCKRRTNLQSGNPARIEIIAAWCAVASELDHHHKTMRGRSTRVENALRGVLGGEAVSGGAEWVRAVVVPMGALDAAAAAYGMVRASVYLSRWDERRVMPDGVRADLEAGYRARLEAIRAEWMADWQGAK